MSKELILLGGGGHCKSVIDVALSAGYSIRGILDKPEKVGATVLGYPVLGPDDDVLRFVDDCDFLITVGQIKRNDSRRRLAEIIKKANGHFATLIAHDAHVSQFATIGEGSVIMHGAVVNAGAVIGENGIVNTMANLEHDVRVGHFCHISTGVMVNGDCRIGDDVFIGSGSIINNGIEICDSCVIASGSCVVSSLGFPAIYAGNPAVFKKYLHE